MLLTIILPNVIGLVITGGGIWLLVWLFRRYHERLHRGQ